MANLIKTLLISFLFSQFTFAIDKFIVLAYGDLTTLEEYQMTYELLDVTINANSNLEEIIDDNYILAVGPYTSDKMLALSFMILKESFPNAVIVEKGSHAKSIEVKSLQVAENTTPVSHSSNQSLWLGLFALALVGILFMFLSSMQIKYLKKEHTRLKLKHQKLEERQHYVLSTMGENIQNIAQETIDHTALIAEKVKNTPLHKELKKVMHHENELLDVTDDLIKFLRLKSKKVVIHNEAFNFNHVLNEVAGLLHYSHKQNDTELIFNIDKKVPKYILADSLQLGQVLTNMLEYLIQNNQSNEIILEVKVISKASKKLFLQFQINTDIVIENSENLFESYYDEVSKRYVGLGLFVAQELTHLMGGELLVIDRDNGKNSFELSIPIEEQNKDKRKYRLPNKGLVGKKVLIVDCSPNAAFATEKLFAYFKAEVTILSERRFEQYMPSFEEYDIVALSNSIFTFKIIASLTGLKKTQGLKIISLDNLFSSETVFLHDAIDIRLKKPLTQEYVFDTLIELYDTSTGEDTAHSYIEEEVLAPLPVYREPIDATENINLESFKIFRAKHLLIVEDNIINQKVVMSILSKSNMIIHVAGNGKEAVDFMRSNSMPIDFIFMDINMPVMDGYRATELIRSDQRFNQVPIVALTALISDHEIDKMFDMGATAYIPKPIRIDKLYTVLKYYLMAEEAKAEVIEENEPIIETLILEGLDTVSGLNNMNGNDISYRAVLKEFLDAYDGSDTTFANLVKEQRFGQVKMLCFDMKGLAGSIGAKEMHIMINEIYQHIVYKKPELLHSYVLRYQKTFAILRTSIKTYLAS
jgi:CheY-like chemotaxis protein/signal transduction histidine kinase